MDTGSEIGSIARVIQLSVAPVFLLTGVGAMLSVLSNRLARAVDRARALEDRYGGATAAQQAVLRDNLKIQARRSRLILRAMSLCALCALLVCAVIVALFASALVGTEVALPIAILFVGAMLAFMAALFVFLYEVRLATTTLRIGPPAVPSSP